MTRLTLDELARLDELQSAYMSALDGKKMRSWLDTFEDDPSASYICIARNDVESGLRVARIDRKSVVWGKSVSVRVDLGGRRIIKNKTDVRKPIIILSTCDGKPHLIDERNSY